VAESANDAIMITEGAPIVEPGPRIEYINPAFTRMTGYAPEEMIGQNPRMLQGPGTAPEARARIRAALEHEEAVRVELLNYRKDGEPFWVEINIVPVRDAAGRLTHWASIQRETTERREAEETSRRLAREEATRAEEKEAAEALRESEAKFSSIISISADAIVSVDEDQEITIFNSGAEQIFGYTADEVLGKPLEILVPESVRDLHRRHVEEFGRSPTMARRMGERGQVSGRRKNGEIFPADASISKIEIGGKKFYTAVLRDITVSMHTEEALRQANENLQALIEASPLAILAVDPDDRIEIWNSAAEQILGWTEVEVLGKPNPIIPEDKREEYEHAVGLGRQGEAVTGLETERVRKDGSRLAVSLSTAPMRGPFGEFRGLVAILEDVTRRREAEDTRRRLTAILEATPDVVMIADPEGHLLYLNRAGRELLGLHGEDEIRGRIITDFHPAWAAAQLLREAIPTAIREGSWSGETMLRTPSGRKIPVLKVLIAHRGDSGEVEYLSSVLRDITERKRIEETEKFIGEASRTLSGSLECRELLKQVSEFIVPRLADYCIIDLIDESGTVHRETLRHSDPERQELIDRLRRFPPRDARGLGVPHVLRSREPDLIPEVTEAWLRAISQSEEHLEILHTLAPRSVLIVPLWARGRVIGAITCAYTESGRHYSEADLPLARDLVGRAALAIENARLYEKAKQSRGEAERRAREEEALREAAGAVNAAFTSEDVIRRIAESALTATNADGAYVEHIDIGRGEVEVVAVAGERAPPLGGRLPYAGSYTERVVESGSPEVVDRLAEARHRLPDDLTRSCPDCSAAVVPLIDAGEPFGALILVRTPEKWIFRPDETARALTFGDLATLVFRRVHFLEESERRREELERVTESRARLMRGFSHDVRNPLGAADGFLQLMEQGIMDSLTEKQRESVRKVRRSIGNALALIEDLLEIARAEAGQIEIEFVPTDLAEAAREIVGEYRAAAEAKGLAISLQLPEQFPVIPSDVSRVRQILGNFISNAVKYTPSGSVTVRVEKREGGQAPGPGRWAVAEVVDTGPGIPEERKELLFHEFKRFTAAGETTGAGIGLAISYRLARALGGEITVESEEGRGSTFALWLPIEHEERRGS
jgi:PAS domain S-box-containing protein